MDKLALRRIIVAKLEAELALQTAAAHSSHSEATDVDSRAEGKFDMRGQSAAYLAAGQAKLATEIAEAVLAYQAMPLRAFGQNEPIASGAIVRLEEGGEDTVYFVGPSRGGMEVEIESIPVTVITAVSALGRSLLGRRTGDRITLAGSTNQQGVKSVE